MTTKINWDQQVEDWKASGLSKLAFCKERSLAYHSFIYFSKRPPVCETDNGFQQVVLQSSDLVNRIDFPFTDGRCVSFPSSTPKEVIRFLVSL